jgi:hypothetical protein
MKIGDKVKVISKSYGCSYENSTAVREEIKRKGYGVIKNIKGNCYNIDGDYFLAKDLRPYKPKVKKDMLTIKLNKEEAVLLWNVINQSINQLVDALRARKLPQSVVDLVNKTDGSHNVWVQLDDQLNAAGVASPETYGQPQPIMIQGHLVKFEKGWIKVGCTTVQNETVKKIAARLK